MNIENYDFVTRCRAIFVMSIAFLNPNIDTMDLDGSFFLNLHEFARVKLLEDKVKYYSAVLSVVPNKVIDKKRQFYESEKTIMDLYNLLSEIDTLEKYTSLLGSVENKTVDKLSSLASEYVDFMYSFDDNYIQTLAPL